MSRYDRDAGFLVPAGALEFAGRLPAEGEADLRLGLSDVDLVFFGGPDGTADVRAEMAGTQTQPAILLERAGHALDEHAPEGLVGLFMDACHGHLPDPHHGGAGLPRPFQGRCSLRCPRAQSAFALALGR